MSTTFRSTWVAALSIFVTTGMVRASFAQSTVETSDELYQKLFLEEKPEEPKLSQAFELWTELADTGDANAQFYLSFLYFGGLGPAELNVEKALELVSSAAAQGHVEAQYRLGNAYEFGQEFGQGYARDYAKAVMWYERAARQGFWLATERLAAAYTNAELGVPKDESRAAFWRSMRK